MLVLWGTHSGQGSSYDLLRAWRDHAGDVRGHGIDSGHFIPEEQPDRVYAALKDFFQRLTQLLPTSPEHSSAVRASNDCRVPLGAA